MNQKFYNSIVRQSWFLAIAGASLGLGLASSALHAGVAQNDAVILSDLRPRLLAPAACSETTPESMYILEMFPPYADDDMGIARVRVRSDSEKCPFSRPAFGGPR